MSAGVMIMGIDPGTNYMGYGVIEIVDGKPQALILGEIDMHKIGDAHQKLRYIFERVVALVRNYEPSEVAFESPFFGTNVQAITGRGQASKEQVATMINAMLGTDYKPRKLDATDGMAVALCHWMTANNALTRATAGDKRKGLGGDSKARKGSSSWESFIKSNPDRVKH